MKITKTLARTINFFFEPKTNNALCAEFIGAVSNSKLENITICRATLSTKDQKEKGYRKITRNEWNKAKFGKKEFPICQEERETLENAGIKIGDSFWVKCELA